MAVKEPTGDLKKACWKGYTAVGMKMKNGRKVPNCVPVSEEECPVRRHYKELKKLPIKDLRDRIKQSSRVVDVSGFDKESAISHILRRQHGDKRVDQAFGLKEETGDVQHLIGITVSHPELKSAEPIFKKARVRASSEEEAIKKVKSHYRKAGYKVHDAFHHSTLTFKRKVDEARSDDPDYDKSQARFKKGLPPSKTKKPPYKEDSYWTKRKKQGTMEEAATSDNTGYGKGYHGNIGGDDKKYSSMHTKVKGLVGAAGHLSDVKKPNVMIKHFLDSTHGRHIADQPSDSNITSRFKKFKNTYNPEMHEGLDEGLTKAINKKMKNTLSAMQGRASLGAPEKEFSWQQNKAKAIKAGRAMAKEEAEQISEGPQRDSTRAMNKLKDAIAGANYRKSGMPTPGLDAKRKTPQALNKAIGRSLRKMEEGTRDLTAALAKKIEKKTGGKETAVRSKKTGLLVLRKNPMKEEFEQMDEAESYAEYKAKHSKQLDIERKVKDHNNTVEKMSRKSSRDIDYTHPKVLKKAPNGYFFSTSGQLHMKEEAEQVEEAHKIGSKVQIVKGAGKGIQGVVGEIRHGAYKGAPKTYTIFHGTHDAIQVPKEHIRAMKEEVEQMNELSRNTLRDYVGKAYADRKGRKGKNAVAAMTGTLDDYLKGAKKSDNRSTGITRAYARLNKEEVEQMNEKHLTPAERKKREEIAQAMERKSPGMDMGKKMAIATAQAKKVAEGYGPKRYGSREDDFGHEAPDKDHVHSEPKDHGLTVHNHEGKEIGTVQKNHPEPMTAAMNIAMKHSRSTGENTEVRRFGKKVESFKGKKVNESKNIIREVIRKAVDKQGTNKANGKTATGAPAAKVQINPSIDLGPNKRGIGGT